MLKKMSYTYQSIFSFKDPRFRPGSTATVPLSDLINELIRELKREDSYRVSAKFIKFITENNVAILTALCFICILFTVEVCYFLIKELFLIVDDAGNNQVSLGYLNKYNSANLTLCSDPPLTCADLIPIKNLFLQNNFSGWNLDKLNLQLFCIGLYYHYRDHSGLDMVTCFLSYGFLSTILSCMSSFFCHEAITSYGRPSTFIRWVDMLKTKPSNRLRLMHEMGVNFNGAATVENAISDLTKFAKMITFIEQTQHSESYLKLIPDHNLFPLILAYAGLLTEDEKNRIGKEPVFRC